MTLTKTVYSEQDLRDYAEHHDTTTREECDCGAMSKILKPCKNCQHFGYNECMTLDDGIDEWFCGVECQIEFLQQDYLRIQSENYQLKKQVNQLLTDMRKINSWGERVFRRILLPTEKRIALKLGAGHFLGRIQGLCQWRKTEDEIRSKYTT